MRVFSETAATSNHALQRTAPRVTLAAADRPAAFAHPAPVTSPQPARRASAVAELGVVRRHLTIMRVKLIKTEGPWLAATVQHGERQLCVMDEFTIDERYAPKPDENFVVELSAQIFEDSSWEAMFAGNPNKTKDLEPLKGWSYRAFGQIVSIHPVTVDCGILFVPEVLHTNDSRVVGEFIAFTISRLDATLYSTDDA